jgi:hypothetical protein
VWRIAWDSLEIRRTVQNDAETIDRRFPPKTSSGVRMRAGVIVSAGGNGAE